MSDKFDNFPSGEKLEQLKRDIIMGNFRRGGSATKQIPSAQPETPKKKTKTTDIGGPNSLENLILKEADRIVPIREGGENGEMRMFEAVIRSLTVSAVGKKKIYAIRLFLSIYGNAERVRYQKLQEQEQRWKNYIHAYEAERRKTKEAGLAAPTRLPFPEDVVFDEEGVSFTGPTSTESAAAYENASRVRNIHLMQHALNLRCAKTPMAPHVASLSSLIAMLIDYELPNRYQLGHIGYVMQQLEFNCMTKRQLLKETHRAWKSIGMEIPRGYTFPVLNNEQLEKIRGRIVNSVGT